MTATPVIGNTFFGLDVSGLSGGFASIRRRISRSTLLIELAPRMLQIAEARQRSRGLEIRHFSRVPLPDGALERSVPTDPEAMAQLLRDLCLEKGIVSHRAAVVLPPELAFQRLVQLPKGLSVKEARDYLLDSKNGVTLPFPLAQTDFDLVPIEAFKPAEKDPGLTTFQLTAIPVSLVDPVLSMLDLAGFDLQGLELGSLSSLHLIKDGLLQLGDAGASLLLEFLPDATLVNLVCAEGLIDSDRLPAIREFPRYELSGLEREQILNRSQSLEQVTVENERYLPLSEMDLRAFFHDLEGGLKNWSQRFPGLILDHVYMFGDGSSHPGLADLLQSNLNCSVKHVRPFLVDGLRDWSLDEPLLQSSLTRLVGLGMGLLGLEQAEDQSQPTPVVDSEVLTSMSSAKGFVEAEPDSQSSDSQQVLTNDHHSDGVRPMLADPESVNEPIDVEVESEWPSLKLDVSEAVIKEEEKVADEAENEAAGDEVSGSVEEESEWPSLKLDVSEAVIKEEKKVADEAENEAAGDEVSGSVEEESEWPSLKLDVSEAVIKEEEKVADEAENEAAGGEVSGSVEEESEWPSLKLDVSEAVIKEEEKVADEAENEAAGDEVSGSVEEESEWPSLKLDVSEAVIKEEEKVADEAENEAVGGEVSGSVEEESEWPSLKLDGSLQVSATLKPDPNLASESNSIPGLSLIKNQHSPPKPKVIKGLDDTNSTNESSDDDSPLGELRFADDQL